MAKRGRPRKNPLPETSVVEVSSTSETKTIYDWFASFQKPQIKPPTPTPELPKTPISIIKTARIAEFSSAVQQILTQYARGTGYSRDYSDDIRDRLSKEQLDYLHAEGLTNESINSKGSDAINELLKDWAIKAIDDLKTAHGITDEAAACVKSLLDPIAGISEWHSSSYSC